MWKNSHVSNAIKRKVQQLYGDVGLAAIRDGFDGSLVLDVMTVISIFDPFDTRNES